MRKRFLSAVLAFGLLLGAASAGSAAAAGDIQIVPCEKADLDGAKVVFSDAQVVADNLDTKDKKAGAASIALGVKAGSKNNYCDLQIENLNIDIGATFTDLNIEFWFYVNDIENLSKNGGESVIELGSSDAMDNQRVLWDLGLLAQYNNIQSGWNKLVLPVGSANIQSVNFRELKRFRLVCYQTNGDLVVKVDDIKFVPNVPSTDPLLFDAESYNPYLYVVHTDGNIKYPVLDTDAKQGKYSIAAVTKGGAANLPAMLMTQAGLPAPIFNFGDVSNKAVEAWIYISDVKYLAESRIEFGSSGSDARNVYWFWLHGSYEQDGKEIHVNKLKTGWNKVTIPFSEAMVKGSPKTDKINWVRIYGVGTGDGGVPLTFKFDDVKIVNAQTPTSPAGDTSSKPAGGTSSQPGTPGAENSRPNTDSSKAPDASGERPDASDTSEASEVSDGGSDTSTGEIVSGGSEEGSMPEDASDVSDVGAGTAPEKKSKAPVIIAVVVIAVLLLGGLGVGGYFYFTKMNKPGGTDNSGGPDAPDDPNGGSKPESPDAPQ